MKDVKGNELKVGDYVAFVRQGIGGVIDTGNITKIYSDDKACSVEKVTNIFPHRVLKLDKVKDYSQKPSEESDDIEQLRLTLEQLSEQLSELHSELHVDIMTAIKMINSKMLKAIQFVEYFDELYGTGLEIANYHLNGELEPFDNFYEAACNQE